MPDVFVTGGSGFIGGALIRRLVADGRKVRALARTAGAAEMVTALGATPIRGDLTDASEWAESLRGCGTLFHVGGVNEMCPRDPAVLAAVNIDATVASVRAAADAGVERMVLTSSASTIGERRGEVGTEATVHSGEYLSVYAETKHRGEQAAFREAERAGLPLVAVNPSSVQGPGRTGGTARLLIGYLKGRLRFAVHTNLSLVSIDDCVAGHLGAEASGTPGERYLLSGWSAPIEEVIGTLRAATRVTHRVRFLPGTVLTATAALVEAGARLVGKQPPLCRESARTIRHGHRFDGSRAERELGLRYTEPVEWVAATAEWYREHGLV